MLKSRTIFDELLEELGIPSFVDFDKFFDNKISFPHFDIEKSGNKITYAFAVAGYAKDCLEAYVENGKLNVRGFVPEKTQENVEKIYNGISKRKFDIIMPLPFGDKFTEYSATYEDGILRITFDLEVKEDSGLKIEIN